MTDEVIITEQEGIELLISLGLSKGEEKETVYYKKYGYINADSSLSIFLEKLQQVYNQVELVINPNSKNNKPYSGKKRLIKLQDKRNQLEGRIDNRLNSGRNEDENISLMTSYIHQQISKTLLLTKEDSLSLTKSKWYEQISLHTLSHEDIISLKDIMKDIYLKHHENININNMLRATIDSIAARINNVYSYTLNKLEQDGYIKTSYEYYAALTDTSDNEPSLRKLIPESLTLIQVAEANLCNQHGIDYEYYKVSRMIPKLSNRQMRDFLPLVDDMLKEKFDIRYYFRRLEIKLLKEYEGETISEDMSNQSFLNRLHKISTSNHNQKKYLNGKTYSNRFLGLNTLLYLRLKGADELDKTINSQLFTLKLDIENIRDNFKNKLEENKNIITQDDPKLTLISHSDIDLEAYKYVDLETGEILYEAM